ncbi:MAG: stress response translation initiation inhibitor YciH [Candidatus Krumholzibacteriia bacterium]
MSCAGDKDGNRLVWSSDEGRIEPERSRPDRPTGGGGRLRIVRETKGRRGKTVTVISGLGLDDDGLAGLAAELKKACGVGGSSGDGVIVIQGDKQDAVAALLKKKGFAGS